MPELPEVETVARGLQASVAGRRILSVSFRKSDFVDDVALIERELPGRTIERVERFGKFMLLRLAAGSTDSATRTPQSLSASALPNSQALLVHLGMTGNLAPSFAERPLEKHTHATFALDDGRELRYTDARRFGRMAYLSGETLAAELRRFGADPLQVGRQEFVERVRGSKARIKALLLDQTVLRGIGNIYADESLWRAKIHPAKPGQRLTAVEAERLRKALQFVLNKAIAAGGSSISDFVDSNGQPGEFQLHHRVYGREGQKCYRCSTTIRRITVAGRSSYFCPRCQPAPRGGKRRGPRKRAKRHRQSGTSKT